ncbi:uncharacterized protein LOC142163339 [Nicotiana tabacum]|uniref:Uncharacterized protein LOC142163339 n=1 Tax=Nicotiana tabacum TaxID=4097 RepID=A0AC58RVE8_TOBAC
MTTSAEPQNSSVGTIVATTNASSSRTTPALAMAPAEKLENEDVPVLGEETPENERFVVTEAWKHSDFLCKNYILSCLEDGLYNVYSIMKTSRELWNALEKKYKTEDVGLKKFVTAKFLDFKMVDDKSVITQVQELQDHKAVEKKSRGNSTIMGENIVEEASTSKKRKKPSGPKNYPSKKKFKECNLVGNPREWWIEQVDIPNETVFMANPSTAKIEGMGKIALKMTSDKIVTLNDVLHVPEMQKNIISTSLLVKNGFKCVFVSDKSSNNTFSLRNITKGLRFRINQVTRHVKAA